MHARLGASMNERKEGVRPPLKDGVWKEGTQSTKHSSSELPRTNQLTGCSQNASRHAGNGWEGPIQHQCTDEPRTRDIKAGAEVR